MSGDGGDRKSEELEILPTQLQARKNVATFLRGLADRLENSEMSEDSQKNISEFFMKFLFLAETLEKVDVDQNEDFLKFLSLGWYVYTQIDKDIKEDPAEMLESTLEDLKID